jgi:hypothetical protein
MATKTIPVRVLTDGEAGPYIMAPVQYVERIREFLMSRHIRFHLDHGIYKTRQISEFTVFNITRDCTEEQVVEIRNFLDGFTWEIEMDNSGNPA